METREYVTIEKTTWGAGPWQSEPDKRQWEDPKTGLPCLIVRNPGGGNLCGYVGVPKEHPAHGSDYWPKRWDDDGNEITLSPVEEGISGVRVHGGLTFADSCGHGADESRGICHAPGEGEPDDVWWFGFDCAHYLDFSPGRARESLFNSGVYRGFDYVRSEVEGLANQLAAIGRAAVKP